MFDPWDPPDFCTP